MQGYEGRRGAEPTPHPADSGGDTEPQLHSEAARYLELGVFPGRNLPSSLAESF